MELIYCWQMTLGLEIEFMRKSNKHAGRLDLSSSDRPWLGERDRASDFESIWTNTEFF